MQIVNRYDRITPNDSYLSDLQKYGNYEYLVGNYNVFTQKKKNFLKETFNRRIALIGDSFSQDFYNIIIEGKHLMNYDLCVYYVLYHCQIYIGNKDQSKFIEPKHRKLCRNAQDIKEALALIHQANIVILASRWKKWIAQRLSMTIKLFNLIKNQQLYIDKSNKYRIKQYQHPFQDAMIINHILEKTIDKSIFINIQKMICTGLNQTCPLFTSNGKLISYDELHLTKYGALYIGNIILKQ